MCNLRFPNRRPMSAPKITVAMIAAPCAPSACHGVENGHAMRIDRETRDRAVRGARYSWPGCERVSKHQTEEQDQDSSRLLRGAAPARRPHRMQYASESDG